MKKSTKILITVIAILILASGITVTAFKLNSKNTDEGSTSIVATETEVVAINDEGELVDAVTGDKLSDEDLDKLEEDGVIEKDSGGKVNIVAEKNKQEVKVTVNDKGEVVADATETDQKAEITSVKKSESAEKKTEKTKTEKSNTTESAKAVNESHAKSEKTTEASKKTEPTTEASKKTEPVTEAKKSESAEKKTEASTEAKKSESKTEAPKKTEPTTEAPKKTEPATEAKKTESKTEALKKTEPTTEAPKKTEPATEAKKTEPKTEEPKKTEQPTEAPKCSHNWVWKTHTETVHHDAVYEEYLIAEAWDKPIKATHWFCNNCGCDLTATYGGPTTDAGSMHLDDCDSGYHNGDVIVGYEHIDAQYGTHCTQKAYDEEITVNDYQYCSKCGERK